MVRAKFTCTTIDPAEGGVTITLEPVFDGSDENRTFFAYTPWGEIRIGTVNPEAARQFRVGHAYYIDFTPAKEG